jgi:hypothetical protein
MADRLADPLDIGRLLELGDDFDLNKAILLVEAATAVVQEATGRPPQRILLVEDATYQILGGIESWLQLPQYPARSVTSVALDGDQLAEGSGYRRFGARLWRACGWQRHRWEPSMVEVVYSHGYTSQEQGIQLGRSAVLSLIRGVYGNPEGAIAVRIDDYSASYGKFAAAMEASEYLHEALSRQYGRRAGLVRTGG